MRRLQISLAVAALGHAVLFYEVSRGRARLASNPRAAVTESIVELDVPLEEPEARTREPVRPAEQAVSARAERHHVAPTGEPHPESAALIEPKPLAAVDLPPAEDAASPSRTADANNEAVPLRRPIDLGLNQNEVGPWEVGQGALPESVVRNESSLRRQAQKVERKLEALLRAGNEPPLLRRSGAVVARARELANDHGPLEGRAIFLVSFDAQGNVVGWQRKQGGAGWDAFAAGLSAKMGGAKAVLPTGAKGMQVELEVQVRAQRPSGADGKSGPVQLDPIKPSLSLNGSFDLADVSGLVQRVASVRVLRETVF